MVNMWMVNTGENSVLINGFKEFNVVAMGWDVEDLSDKNPKEIKEILRNQNPNGRFNKLNQAVNFVRDFKIGDFVFSFDSKNKKYLIGKILSDYYYSEVISKKYDFNYKHLRDVEWIGETNNDDLDNVDSDSINFDSDIKVNNNIKYELLEKMDYDKIEWTDFYIDFANKLLEYKNNRVELINKIKHIFEKLYMTLDNFDINDNVDPFTVFSLFNKKTSIENRISLVNMIKKEFSLSSKAPYTFHGLSLVNLRPKFYYLDENYDESQIENNIDGLWELFELAVNYSQDKSKEFISLYDEVCNQNNLKWEITVALNWVNPFTFLSLDNDTRNTLANNGNVFSEDFRNYIKSLKYPPKAEQYLHICKEVLNQIKNSDIYSNFPELIHGKYYDFSDFQIYDMDNFIEEVYISKDDYLTLVNLLKNKKNIIIQGPPGVGKTFMAKRLAYSILGLKDSEKVKMVQFHQSYSYEDFVMGYRPYEKGFKLKYGPFYTFCKKADKDKNNDYFFIIDEINRGNISKIFGELFMLIESDKRGNENKIQLVYSDEMFYIPDNVYIIGLMNTADRSIAMIDFALRRRFSFFDLKPGFGSEGFKEYKNQLDNEKFNQLINCIKKLNSNISADDSLGEGFEIGHSYLSNIKPEEIEDRLYFIVNHELIPLLKEYWFDESEKADIWSENLLKCIK